MKCQTIKQQSDAFLDNTLSDVEEMAIRVHLQQCVECQYYMQQITKIREGLKSLPIIEIRNGFAEQALNKTCKAMSAAHRKMKLKIGMAFVAGLSIVAIITWNIVSSSYQ
ncbi:MAG: zf-HC2 domain-containing protein [Gammaproteobacteria bacterium]|nr:zf-HC2 domain-containing protein [Gammaproteobacteria bacterium]